MNISYLRYIPGANTNGLRFSFKIITLIVITWDTLQTRPSDVKLSKRLYYGNQTTDKHTDKQATILYKSSLKKQWRNLIVRDNCHPLKASLLIWFQLPVWVCMSFALRNLVYMPVENPEALVTFMELSVGGFSWIPNLTEPDHSWILPVAFGLTNLTIIEIQSLSKLRQPSKLYNFFTNVFRIFTIVMIPVAANVPSCMCLYWMTSSGIGLVQNLVLLSPSLRRKLRIPLAPSELEEPYKHIKEELRHKLKKYVPKLP